MIWHVQADRQDMTHVYSSGLIYGNAITADPLRLSGYFIITKNVYNGQVNRFMNNSFNSISGHASIDNIA